MNTKFFGYFSLILVFVSGVSVQAADYTSANFILRDPVVTVGGARSTSASFEYFSSTGQSVIGESTSATMIERAGFLYFTAPTVTVTPSPSGGGSGGGGGSGQTITGVTFSGRAYPLSKVTILKDGQLAITTIAGPDAIFSLTLSGLSSGSYNFSVYGEDSQSRRSTLFTFPIAITAGANTTVGGIFIAPTISVDKTQVKQGDNLAIFGQSAPGSEVTIAVNSQVEQFAKTESDKDGAYLYNLDTVPLEIGAHITKSKATLAGKISPFGNAVGFTVGEKTVLNRPEKLAEAAEKSDFNTDNRVNLIDFSILSFWYNRPLIAVVKSTVDLNHDGKVNLTDFSIMAFHWTG